MSEAGKLPVLSQPRDRPLSTKGQSCKSATVNDGSGQKLPMDRSDADRQKKTMRWASVKDEDLLLLCS